MVIGSAGIFALETKKLGRAPSGRRGWPAASVAGADPDRPTDGGAAVGQAKNNARRLYSALRATAGSRTWVTPVLVVWADHVPDPVQVKGVWVVGGPQLSD